MLHRPGTDSVRLRLLRAITAHRRVFVVTLHLALIPMSNYAAFWLRFDGRIPEPELALFWALLPWLVVTRALAFVPFRLYEGLWRYVGLHDLRRILSGIVLSSFVFYVYVHLVRGIVTYPRSVVIIDALLLAFVMGGVRMAYRMSQEVRGRRPGRRVLIYGAGDTGEAIVRDMLRHHERAPVGFVDDDASLVGRRIHGVPVLGTRLDLARILSTTDPHEILIAIPSAEPPTLREIAKALTPFGLPITISPRLGADAGPSLQVRSVRRLRIEDLLPRAPIGLDPSPVQRLLTGQRVMVTGAGGSIGSELARQIASLRPSALVLYERYENSLYAIGNELAERDPYVPVHSVIGDVTDRRRLDAVLAEHRPTIVFHAAAHKHVPLMEWNPCEAIKNNVLGTHMLALAAIQRGVRRVVVVSTDKAVAPSSVMGASKRVAELIVQALRQRSRTAFVTVRFGNVLGSNGSVVPRFMQQIESGGPVTVTHPEMRRYFMLISEAVQLVLHAATLGEQGALYALDMGEQVKLVDLARHLIALSGRTPEDIAITYTGVRPGEKLSEVLVGEDEDSLPSGVDKLWRVAPRHVPDPDVLLAQVSELERLARAGDATAALDALATIVPGFGARGSAESQHAQAPAQEPSSARAGWRPAAPTPTLARESVALRMVESR
jgi:FlaA1/EpsC-like NDP-sugar epimerase